MIPIVLDCGVLISAIGWTGNPRRCLVFVARRQLRVSITDVIWNEYERRVPAVLQITKPDINPIPTLTWLLSVSRFVDPAVSDKQRSRDPKDDPYLACALAANASYIVSNDRDLLALEKPFGVRIVTPVQLLAEVQKA